MTQLYQINVKLSDNQKKNIAEAYKKRETVIIRLTNDALSGNDTLNVPATVKKRLEKIRKKIKVWISSSQRPISENKLEVVGFLQLLL